MERQGEEPKYHIVSLRVSTRERNFLHKLCGATNRCISDVMRDALHRLPSPEERRYPALARLHFSRRRTRRHS